VSGGYTRVVTGNNERVRLLLARMDTIAERRAQRRRQPTGLTSDAAKEATMDGAGQSAPSISDE
jgi:hypothetical protein